MSLAFKRGFLLSKPDNTSKRAPKPLSRSAKETGPPQATSNTDDSDRKRTALSSPDSDEQSSLLADALASLLNLSEDVLSHPIGGFTMRICMNIPTDSASASAFCVWAMRPDLQADFPVHQHFKPCSNNSYRIGASAISGSGMFALRDFTIGIGESIMMEQPVLLRPKNDEGLDVRLEILLTEAAAATIRTTLTPAKVAQFDSLTICESKRCLGPAAGKVSTNGIPCRFPQSKDDPMYMGLFLDISRCNHSCVPNATWSFDSRTLTMELRALRPIKKGEEITVAYLMPFTLRSERQEFLSRSFSFVCTCPACTLPPQEASKRDAAIDKIYAAYEKVERSWDMALHNPRRLLRPFVAYVGEIETLIEQYTAMEIYHSDFDHCLAKAYAMLGDEEKSREWARNAKNSERLDVVKGFGFVEKYKEDWDAWINDPTSSPYWRKM